MTLKCNNIEKLKQKLENCATTSKQETDGLSMVYSFDESIVKVFNTGTVQFQGKVNEELNSNIANIVQAINVVEAPICVKSTKK